MYTSDFIQDTIPNILIEYIHKLFGNTFSDETILQSVQQASHFFNLDLPFIIKEDWTTGICPNSYETTLDDILFFNREQLTRLKITGRDGLDLIMTHESAHRALQNINHGFNRHQEELCCDFMIGVRAGLNDINTTQIEDALINTKASQSHPSGIYRIKSIKDGVEFAKTYYNQHDMAPTFSECLDYFNKFIDSY